MAESRTTLTLIQTDAREIAINEQKQARKEIVETREKLGEMTLRDFSEGLFGEEYTKIVYGEKGGEIKMNDLKFEMTGTEMAGQVGLQLNREQLVEIMQDAHPGLTHEGALAMLTNQPEEILRVANQYLSEHEDSVDDAIDDAQSNFAKILREEAKKDMQG